MTEPTERAGGVREAAIEACEKQALTYLNGPARTVYGQAYQAACRDCAAAIAALSPPAAPAEGAVKVKALREALSTIAEHTDPEGVDNYRSDDREGCLDTVHAIAAAALTAAPAPAVDSGAVKVPDGWMLVPVEPTEAMQWAGWRAKDAVFSADADPMRDPANCYRAMLTAAPAPAVDSGAVAEGEAVAWTYELASTVNQQTRERGGWKPWLSWHKPYVPEDAIRNLTPLFAHPPAGEARIAGEFRAVSDNGKRWRIVPEDGDWEMVVTGHVTARQAEAICKRITTAEARLETMARALKALYEWYDRDGSVGGASVVFDANRKALLPVNGEG